MIITSLLDTDLYKFTMMQAVLHQFPGANVEYRFKCRNPGIKLAHLAQEIRDEIKHLCTIDFLEDELQWLRGLRFIKSDFVDFLGLFRLNEKYITVTPLDHGELEIVINGPWLHTILFEFLSWPLSMKWPLRACTLSLNSKEVERWCKKRSSCSKAPICQI